MSNRTDAKAQEALDQLLRLSPKGPWIIYALLDGKPANVLETKNLKKVRKFVRLMWSLGLTVRFATRATRATRTHATIIENALAWQPKGPWTFSAVGPDSEVYGVWSIANLQAEHFKTWCEQQLADNISVVLQQNGSGKALPMMESIKRAENANLGGST